MRGKRPTVAQRRVIETVCRLNADDWLIQKNSPDLLQIVHRYSDKIRVYRKAAGQLQLINVKGAAKCETNMN